MKFLALIYSDESAWDSLGDADRSSMIEQYMAFSRDAEAAGVVLGGAFFTDRPDLDEAIRLAALVPAAEYGSMEIRPIVEH